MLRALLSQYTDNISQSIVFNTTTTFFLFKQLEIQNKCIKKRETITITNSTICLGSNKTIKKLKKNKSANKFKSK